jgi:hypothetical protein
VQVVIDQLFLFWKLFNARKALPKAVVQIYANFLSDLFNFLSSTAV